MRQAKGQTSIFEELGLEDPSGLIKAAPPQTQLKHEAYARYVPRWLDVFKVQGDEVYVLDLYAGPGVYLVDGNRSAGSPVIAARALQAVHRALPRFKGHLRCVEPNRRLRKLLNAELNPYRADVDIVVLAGKAQDHAAHLAAECRGVPTLVLLDPNGIEVPMAMIKRFGGREKTEVLVSFDAHANRRVAGTEDTEPVTAFWGDQSWERYRRDDYTIDLIEILEGYRQRLSTVGGFRISTIRRLRFRHIDRAIAQACGSTLGPRIWLQAFEGAAARFGATVVDVAPLNRRIVLDAALAGLRRFAGRTNVNWGSIYQDIAGVCDREEDLTQALLQLKELGAVDWSGRLGRYEHPRPKFRFADEIPLIRWDGVERSEARQLALVGAGF
jgi:three-Cys-motif partner protein